MARTPPSRRDGAGGRAARFPSLRQRLAVSPVPLGCARARLLARPPDALPAELGWLAALAVPLLRPRPRAAARLARGCGIARWRPAGADRLRDARGCVRALASGLPRVAVAARHDVAWGGANVSARRSSCRSLSRPGDSRPRSRILEVGLERTGEDPGAVDTAPLPVR